MKKPTYFKATGVNCGIYALLMILNQFNFNIEGKELENIVIDRGISYFGEIYNLGQVESLLKLLQDMGYEFNYEILKFNNDIELKARIERILNNGGYALLPYYAFQGFVITSNNPNMNRGHWMVIYDIQGDLIYGIQSNSKAELLGALNGVNVGILYKSNLTLNDVKINWGKYHKCKINIPKKELGIRARCNSDKCLINNRMESSKCIYNCDLGNWIIGIYK